MLIIDIIWEVLIWAWEHRKAGLTWATITSLLWVVVDKMGRKLITHQLKRLFHVRDKSEFKTYVANQKRIESKLDALMSAGGIQWNVEEHALTGSTEKSTSQSSQAAISHADSAKEYTHRMNNLLRLGRMKMKEYLRKLGSRKFQALLTSLVVNIVSGALFAFGVLDIDEVINTWMPIINMTIGTISTWVYIIVEGSRDKAIAVGEAQVNVEKAKATGGNNAESYSDTDHAV